MSVSDWKKERSRLEGMSAPILADQYMKALKRIEIVAAQCAALGAKQIKDNSADLDLLERIAWTLRSADEAASALQSVPFDPAGHHTPHPNDRAIPGSSTRAARYQRDKLERALEQALDAWEGAKQDDFRPASKSRAPKVRCRRRDCVRYDRRVPAWDFQGVPNEFCSGCGERLPAPQEAA